MPRRIYVWLIPKGTTPLIHPILNQWLDIYQHNIPTTSLLINVEAKKEDKRKGDDTKSEDKDSNTGGTAGAHVEDTTINKNSTASSGGASLGAHVLETNQAPFRPSRMVDEILGAYPMNDDFWGNTNPTDVSIDTANSEEIMARSYITNFYTHK